MPDLELSLQEKERRYAMLRGKLKRAGLSAILIYGGTQMGTPVHYLTQIWGNRNNMVIFPAEGEPVFLIPSNSMTTVKTVVQHGCWIPEKNIHLSANLAVDTAKYIDFLRLQDDIIGIDSFRFWPVFEYRTLQELCPKTRLVDAFRLFGEIRGPKSAEELALINKAIQISDLAHYTFLANLKPGITEEEAARRAVEVLDSHEIGDRIILIHSRPNATYPNYPGRTVIQKPDPVTFSLEFARRKGYGSQMIREYWWEEPQGIYKRMFELWAQMREMVVREFRPGVEITAVGKKIKELVADYGFECDKLGHAVGISYGDVPYITAGPDEKDYIEWTILTGEVYVVHPMVRCKGYVAPFTMLGDMYLVGEDNTSRLTTTLPGLPEYIPQ
jgi:Xaa-Pro aminopeptidase